MHYRELGKTGIKVSVLGMGSSPFRYGSAADCAQLLAQGVELGITYYDTARSYVNGEESVGLLPPAVRDKLTVATKTGARGGRHCLRDLQTSLNTLKTRQIGVWMAHMIETWEEYEQCTALGGFCDIAASAKNAGLVQATGASFHAPTNLILRAIEERAFDVVMFQFNVIGRETLFGSSIASYRDILIPAAHRHGVGVVTMKVLAGGELHHGARGLGFLADEALGRNEIGGAVRYATLHPQISTAVVGMSSTDELVQNVMAVEGVDDHQREQFDAWTRAVERINEGACIRCGKCLPVCPEGIEIPKIFRLYDQMRFFGMEGIARYKYHALDRNATACTHCGECVATCPEGVDIPASLEIAHGELAMETQRA